MSKASYEELEQENSYLRERVTALEGELLATKAELAEVKALLKKVLGQDSRNSHKAPSGDKKR